MFAHSRLRFVAAVFVLLLMTSLVAAQEQTITESTPEVTEEPVMVIEPTPVPEITEEATVAPTAAPTEITPEVTEEPQEGSETPAPEETDAPTAEPDVPTPDVVSAPPVFEIASSLSAQAGQPLSIPFAVYDEQGAVVLTQIISAAGAQTTLAIVAPIQTSPPFATTGTISYTPADTFSGADTLTLTAVDGAGTTATTTIQIEVQPLVEVTEEATAEATPEATQEATAEATAEATQEVVPQVERIISYDPAADEAALQAMLTALNATEVSRIPQLGAMKVLVPQELANPARALAAVQSNQAADMAGGITIEENIIYQLDAQSGLISPNDPEFNNGTAQWPLRTFTGSINGQNAWLNARRDGAGVLVAVLDSGVDLQHPDLAGQLDTARGWDFFNDDNNPDDDHNPGGGPRGHGTHIAGIIAAKTNNNLFMAGLAYKAKIIPVKVCGTNNDCPAFEVAAGIVHAVDKGAHIVNLSLSSPTISTTMQGAVQYAIARNVTVIASAGSTGGTALQYPASFPNVISVVAHDISGNIWANSTQNSEVDVSGPGVDVYSLTREGEGDVWRGTSSAAAYVTGAAALLYADNVARTPAAIREALICSAQDAGPVGYDNAFGYGIVQAHLALRWDELSNCRNVVPNDQFLNATLIKKAPFSLSQLIHSRSVTADAHDPGDCGPRTQTLWYKFIPPANGRYQITSFGSTYDNRLAVYQGVQGLLVRQESCGAVWVNGDSYVSVDMHKGQVYYIMLANTGSPVNDQTALLDIRPTLSVEALVDDNNKAIKYLGNWERSTVLRRKVMNAADNSSLAIFSFQGTGFDLFRVVGPAQGAIEVWINNQQIDFNPSAGGIQNLDNSSSLLDIQSRLVSVPNMTHGKQNTVIIRRASTGPSQPIAIDSLFIYNTKLKTITGKADDRVSGNHLAFFQGWNPVEIPGMYKNTGMRTTDPNGVVRAAVKGSTVIIYRNIGPGYGSMNIEVDGVLWGTVTNNHPNRVLSVPIAITNLTPTVHLIRLVNNNNSIVEFDAIEGRVTPAFPANSVNSPGNSRALRSGPWLEEPRTEGGKKVYIASSPTDRMDFNFVGNAFCLAFVRQSGGGTIDIYVDDMNFPHERMTTNTSPVTGYFRPPDSQPANSVDQLYCTGAAFVEGVHHVRLVFNSGSDVWLTGLQFGRFGVLTSQNGLVQENDRRLPNTASLYSTFEQAQQMAALWKRITVKFDGGAKAQGGYVKRAAINPSSPDDPVIRFYMRGTGFIIYTTRGPGTGQMRVLVCQHTDPEDCNPAIMTHVINLALTTPNTPNRARPLAYAVTGLKPGIYLIKIFAEGSTGQYVDFDGVRVLP